MGTSLSYSREAAKAPSPRRFSFFLGVLRAFRAFARVCERGVSIATSLSYSREGAKPAKILSFFFLALFASLRDPASEVLLLALRCRTHAKALRRQVREDFEFFLARFVWSFKRGSSVTTSLSVPLKRDLQRLRDPRGGSFVGPTSVGQSNSVGTSLLGSR